MTIMWNHEKMSIGIPAIDTEHQEWIYRFNMFEASILSGNGTDMMLKALDSMVDYTEKHFAHEETLAGDRNNSYVKVNRVDHNNFRIKIHEIRKCLNEVEVSLVEVISLEIDLEEWVVRHICEVDPQLWLSQEAQAAQVKHGLSVYSG